MDQTGVEPINITENIVKLSKNNPQLFSERISERTIFIYLKQVGFANS